MKGCGEMSTKSASIFLVLGCLSFIIGGLVFIFLLFTKGIGIALLYGFFFFILMIVFVAVFGTIDSTNQKKQRNLLLSLRPQDQNFNNSLSFASADLLTRITTDQVNERLYIWTPKEKNIATLGDVKPGMSYSLATFNHSDILAVEYLEDETVVKQLKRPSPLAESWLEKSSDLKNSQVDQEASEDKIHTISLKIFVKNETTGTYTINFYHNSVFGLRKKDDEYKKIQVELQKWLTLFQEIIKKVDRQDEHLIESDEVDVLDNAAIQNVPKSRCSEKEIVKMKLIATLKQVLLKKQETSSIHGSTKTNQLEQTSSYFEDILKKNREMMHGKKDR